MSHIRVVPADDHEIVRQDLKSLLERREHISMKARALIPRLGQSLLAGGPRPIQFRGRQIKMVEMTVGAQLRNLVALGRCSAPAYSARRSDKYVAHLDRSKGRDPCSTSSCRPHVCVPPAGEACPAACHIRGVMG
jgi:hypothetical protein